MTTQEAISAIHSGKLVTCTAEEWPELRTAIQKQAATWIDQKQDLRAMIALQEVQRLDREHNFTIG